ncbi:MAG: methyltransferase [Pirellulaceae bacterium]
MLTLLLLGAVCIRVVFRVFNNATDRAVTSASAMALESELGIRDWHYVPDLDVELAQFDTVFWEPDDTSSLRDWLRNAETIQGSQILEIGTGTGIISITALKAGARKVVATDINPNACTNANYNKEALGLSGELEVRQVSKVAPAAFSVIGVEEKFDFIISNPPWEDAEVREVAAHALYDPDFELLDGLLVDGREHLEPGGLLLLAYGAKTAIQRILTLGPKTGWQVEILDPRELDSLPEVFLPGMLLKLSPITMNVGGEIDASSF